MHQALSSNWHFQNAISLELAFWRCKFKKYHILTFCSSIPVFCIFILRILFPAKLLVSFLLILFYHKLIYGYLLSVLNMHQCIYLGNNLGMTWELELLIREARPTSWISQKTVSLPSKGQEQSYQEKTGLGEAPRRWWTILTLWYVFNADLTSIDSWYSNHTLMNMSKSPMFICFDLAA